MERMAVCKVQDLPEGKMRGVRIGANRVLVANVDGKYYAMRAICNHMGGLLDEGSLDKGVITCPLHGSRWDVKTGKLVWFTKPLNDEPTYKVFVEGDTIFVEA